MGAGVFAEGGVGTAAAVAISESGIFAFEVERLGQFAGGEDLEGGLGEGVEPLGGGLSLGPATEGVVAGEQGSAVTQAVQGYAVESHFGHFGTVGQKRRMGHSQEARAARVGIGEVFGFDRETDRRGYRRVDRALELGEDRAERGMAVLFASWTFGIAAQAHVGIVLVGTAVERANDGELVHHLGETRHVLADFDAGDVGGNRAERATDLGRGLHLEVVHVLV